MEKKVKKTVKKTNTKDMKMDMKMNDNMKMKMDSNSRAGRGLGISSLVLGIIGVASIWTPFLAIILSSLAIIFGGVSKHRNCKNKNALAGLILGIIGFVISLVIIIVAIAVYGNSSYILIVNN